MVWYGMVWYGMVWYGMVWFGMVWFGMIVVTLTVALKTSTVNGAYLYTVGPKFCDPSMTSSGVNRSGVDYTDLHTFN